MTDCTQISGANRTTRNETIHSFTHTAFLTRRSLIRHACHYSRPATRAKFRAARGDLNPPLELRGDFYVATKRRFVQLVRAQGPRPAAHAPASKRAVVGLKRKTRDVVAALVVWSCYVRLRFHQSSTFHQFPPVPFFLLKIAR